MPRLIFPASPYCEAFLRLLDLRLARAWRPMPEIELLLGQGIKLAGGPRNEDYRRQLLAACQTLRALADYRHGGGRDWERIRTLAGRLGELALPKASQSDSAEKTRLLELFGQFIAEVVYYLTGNLGTPKYARQFLFDTQPAMARPVAAIEADIQAMQPVLALLFELVLGLDQAYAAKKQAAGMIDFSDFEHLALLILRQEEVRRYYRTRFQEVYVDEYQDTSSIQEAVIAAVSDGNCLMVGDIKQSIYRFRHARPAIFLEKAAEYRAGSQGSLFELNRNFRSVPGILDAVNHVFSQLMSPGAGEIDYDQTQALVPHRPDDPDQPAPVHILLVNRQMPAAALQTAPADGGSPDSGMTAQLNGDCRRLRPATAMATTSDTF